MKQRYRLYRRESGLYYSIDTLVNKRKSLHTADSQEAHRLLNAMNEACCEQTMNLQIAQFYLQHSDVELVKRTWQDVRASHIGLPSMVSARVFIYWETGKNHFLKQFRLTDYPNSANINISILCEESGLNE